MAGMLQTLTEKIAGGSSGPRSKVDLGNVGTPGSGRGDKPIRKKKRRAMAERARKRGMKTGQQEMLERTGYAKTNKTRSKASGRRRFRHPDKQKSYGQATY